MEPVDLIVGCFVACFPGSFLLGVLESLGVAAFLLPVFSFGPRALELEEFAALPPGLVFPANGETAHAKYRVISGHTCLFRCKYRLFEPRFTTPLEIKGTISWTDGRLRTMGRYPLGAVAFFALWLLVWTGVNICVLVAGHLMGGALLLVGWLSVGPVVEVSRSTALRQFGEISADVLAALLSTPAGDDVHD